MFTIQKRLEVSASHHLSLPYESKCNGLHGHNFIITLWCQSEQLNNNGLVIDFTDIKQAIHGALDHKHLNDVLPIAPTAENIAKWCVDQIPTAYKCSVQESEGNIATYEKI